MLLSISNSNYKLKIIWLITLSILLYVLVNASAFHYWKIHRAKLESKSIYAEDTQGLADLMFKKVQQASALHPDIIFVGNSTTKVHISSKIFKENNFNIFNYGLLGYSLGQYPAMVENAIKAKPKVIVISIDKPELYYPIDFFYNSYSHGDLNYYDVLYLAKHLHQRLGHIVLSKFIWDYLQQINIFKIKGYLITNKINTEFNKFNIEKTAAPVLSLSGDFCADEFVSKYYQGCNNGDVDIDGSSPTLTRDEFGMIVKHGSEAFNFTIASMLNELITKIKQAGIQPIIVFIPQFRHHVIENEKLIAETLQAPVIDMSDSNIPYEAWSDTEHMNTKGKAIYSNKLAVAMKSIVKIY